MKFLAHCILIGIPALFMVFVVKAGIMLVCHIAGPEAVSHWGLITKLSITIGFVALGFSIVVLLTKLIGGYYFRGK